MKLFRKLSRRPKRPASLRQPEMTTALPTRTSARLPSLPSASVASVSEDSSSEDNQSLTSSDGIQRDTLFYSVPLILLVERSLFRVPRSYFEKNSDVFRETYLYHHRGEEVADGLTDQQPLRLDGVGAAEFGCLLHAMVRGVDADMSWTRWTSVLKLSLMWQMKLIEDLALKKIPDRIHNPDEWVLALKISTQSRIQGLREIAIRKLARGLSSLQKVELAIECSIEPWLTEGYTAFVTREEGISIEDEEHLGPSRTANLFRVRHRRLEARHAGGVRLDIQRTFSKEFADIIAFDTSPISYLRSDLHAATDPDVIQRDKTYYCVDTIFKVEDTLFKVPRYLFEESSDVFRDMFQLPAQEDAPRDGSSDENPLYLPGICKTDFRLLLKAMNFPASRDSRSRTKKSQKTPSQVQNEEEPMRWNDWGSVLELSCMWQMAEVQEMAVKKILECRVSADDQKVLLKLSTKLGITEIRNRATQALSGTLKPIERVQFGMECQVDSWLLEGLRQLVEAPGGISVEHEKRLEWNITSRLFRVREQYLQTRNSTYGHYSAFHAAPNARSFVTDRIKEVFAEELKNAVWAGK